MSGSEQETIDLLGFIRQVGFAMSPQEETTIGEPRQELSLKAKQAERNGSADAIRATVNALWRKGTECDLPFVNRLRIQWFAFPVLDPSQAAGCTENGR